LQRLFSTFPGSWPGVALLLLRATVSVTAIAQGAMYLSNGGRWTLELLFSCLLLLAGGFCLLIGFLTPVVIALVGIVVLANAISPLLPPSGDLLHDKLASLEMIAMVIAIALLGPGAFSADARLFGRSEIVIPPSLPGPKS